MKARKEIFGEFDYCGGFQVNGWDDIVKIMEDCNV
jgi:hypothetical protein